jgi:hypothetical protein
MIAYAYNPDGTRDLEYQCPTCDGGTVTLTLRPDRSIVKAITDGCTRACESGYANGYHDEVIQAAIAAADRIEANGPTETQLERLYDTAGGIDYDHRMAEARKYK